MGLFDDKKYDEMDWLAKACEPVIASVNDALAQLPDEFVLSNDLILKLMFQRSYSSGSFETSDVVHHLMPSSAVNSTHFEKIKSCYDIRYSGELTFYGGERPRVEGNGIVKVVKIKSMFEESELQKEMGIKSLHNLTSFDHNDVPVERFNEILELIEGSNEIRACRSTRQKQYGLKDLIQKIFEENKWNIKNVDLADKVVLWIYMYLKDGNLAALTNFCKFKVMTHSGEAIYSVQEEPL